MRSSLKPTPWINKNNHHGASEVQISFKYDQRWSLTLRFTPYTHTPPWSRSFPSSESLNWTSSSKWTTLRWIHYVLKPSCHCGGGVYWGRWEGLFTGSRAAWRHLSSLTYLHHQGSKPASHASWTWWTLDPGSSSGPCDAKRPSWWWCPGDACRGGMQTKVRGRCPCDE